EHVGIDLPHEHLGRTTAIELGLQRVEDAGVDTTGASGNRFGELGHRLTDLRYGVVSLPDDVVGKVRDPVAATTRRPGCPPAFTATATLDVLVVEAHRIGEQQ